MKLNLEENEKPSYLLLLHAEEFSFLRSKNNGG